jgi:hypothetical protein
MENKLITVEHHSIKALNLIAKVFGNGFAGNFFSESHFASIIKNNEIDYLLIDYTKKMSESENVNEFKDHTKKLFEELYYSECISNYKN